MILQNSLEGLAVFQHQTLHRGTEKMPKMLFRHLLISGFFMMFLSFESGPAFAASSPCISPSPWKPKNDSEGREYISASGNSTLLEFGAPGTEDEKGSVPAASTAFLASFTGLRPNRRYVLKSTIDVKRSDSPYSLWLTNLRLINPAIDRAVKSGTRKTFSVVVVAEYQNAAVSFHVSGHHKMWAFVSDTSLCPIR